MPAPVSDHTLKRSIIWRRGTVPWHPRTLPGRRAWPGWTAWPGWRAWPGRTAGPGWRARPGGLARALRRGRHRRDRRRGGVPGGRAGALAAPDLPLATGLHIPVDAGGGVSVPPLTRGFPADMKVSAMGETGACDNGTRMLSQQE